MNRYFRLLLIMFSIGMFAWGCSGDDDVVPTPATDAGTKVDGGTPPKDGGSVDGTVTDGGKGDAAVDAADAADAAPSKFTVGGTVTGLTGTGLVLQNNAGDDLAVSASGAFKFATPIATGATFNVTVKTQPTNPSQSCSVSGATGTMGTANVTSVTVNCAANRYTIGGTISGLAGTVVLQNNGGDDLSVTTNGTFAFSAPVASGATYAVTVKTQPGTPSQTCTVTAGTGTVGSANVTGVLVACVTNKYTVGGTVAGLAGGSVTLKNGAENLTVSANGPFTFTTAVASAAGYAVTVATQPTGPAQTCTITGGTGTITNANVTNVTVTCVTNQYTVGGTVSGLVGTGLVLQNNGTDALPIAANGPFTFPTAIASGASFAVTVSGQPSGPTQNCVVTGGSGTIGSANVTGVVVNCATNSYTVGGTITGLAGSVVLQNGTDTVTVSSSGSFAFPQPVPSGTAYNVVVLTQPSSPSQVCTVTNGSGTVTAANVETVAVSCVTSSFTVGGTLSGLAVGASVVLANNGGDNLILTGNGDFTFATPVLSSASYSVTVVTQPSSPTQACTVTNPSGNVGAGNVTSVQVNCVTTSFAIGGTITGLAGSGLVLQNNGADDLPIGGNGPFVFPVAIASGLPYSVTIKTQPSGPTQACDVTGGSGTVGASDVTTVQINCATSSFTVGGTITGLAGTVVLQNNGGGNLSVSTGSFAFPAAPSGTPYNVTVLSNPTTPAQDCVVTSGGSGTIGGQNVVDIVITCTTRSFTVGGNIVGLSGGASLVLQNGSDTLTRTVSGAFTFGAAVPSGMSYSVSVLTQPAGQACAVTSGGSGTIGSTNVTNVIVKCSPTSCKAIKDGNASATDGSYGILIGGVPYTVYCDMTNGGWTEVQDHNVALGYPTAAQWEAGLNQAQPNGGLYSILNLLSNLKSGTNYEFRLDWPTLPGAYIQWTQVENPIVASQVPTISGIVSNPVNQGGCGAFRGLAKSSSGQPTLLHGDANTLSCWWFAVGVTSPYGVGIPAYNTYGTPTVNANQSVTRDRLFVR
jgi:hypothetical protein